MERTLKCADPEEEDLSGLIDPDDEEDEDEEDEEVDEKPE